MSGENNVAKVLVYELWNLKSSCQKTKQKKNCKILNIKEFFKKLASSEKGMH